MIRNDKSKIRAETQEETAHVISAQIKKNKRKSLLQHKKDLAELELNNLKTYKKLPVDIKEIFTALVTKIKQIDKQVPVKHKTTGEELSMRQQVKFMKRMLKNHHKGVLKSKK